MRSIFRFVLEAAMMIGFVLFFMALRSALESLNRRQAAAGLNPPADPFAEQDSVHSPAFLRRNRSN